MNGFVFHFSEPKKFGFFSRMKRKATQNFQPWYTLHMQSFIFEYRKNMGVTNKSNSVTDFSFLIKFDIHTHTHGGPAGGVQDIIFSLFSMFGSSSISIYVSLFSVIATYLMHHLNVSFCNIVKTCMCACCILNMLTCSHTLMLFTMTLCKRKLCTLCLMSVCCVGSLISYKKNRI